MIRLANRPVLVDSAEPWICAVCRNNRQHRAANRSFSGHVSQLIRHNSRSISRPRNLIYHLRPLQKHASTFSDDGKLASSRNEKLPEVPARTRFAPSPTGYMHIGGLRTALFSYLLAKRTNGQFLLRIEDTDRKRLVPDAEDRLCEDLQWAGLQWDEGPQAGGPYGPYKQSERTEIYQQHARHLLDGGTAYRCFCTQSTTGSKDGNSNYVTSGCYQDCASLSLERAQERAMERNEAFTIRLKQPSDVHKRVYFDLVYGKIQRLKRSPSAGPQAGGDDFAIEAADTILVKSDGTPTYHFANVIDDHLMKITHVIRGTEWMASTPLHYDLYSAFGWNPPNFAHVGLLVDENQTKLSKRSNNGLVLDVRGMHEEQGILPESLCNFLALLGWSNPGRNDVMEVSELIRAFDLKFTKGNTIVRMEKLWYLQKHHVTRRCERARLEHSLEPIQAIVDQVCEAVSHEITNASGARKYIPETLTSYCTNVLLADSKSYQTPKQYVQRNRYFFAFDSAEVPEGPEFYDQKQQISGRALSASIRTLLTEFDFTQQYREPLFPSPKADTEGTKIDRSDHFADIERTSARIHAAINHLIWRILYNHSLPNPNVEPRDTEANATHPITSGSLAFTDKPIDMEANARHIWAQSSGRTGDETAGAKELLRQYKEWNKAVMRFLREKLSYGLPGPGVGVIMAILGYEECCRRLSIEAKKRSGW